MTQKPAQSWVTSSNVSFYPANKANIRNGNHKTGTFFAFMMEMSLSQEKHIIRQAPFEKLEPANISSLAWKSTEFKPLCCWV